MKFGEAELGRLEEVLANTQATLAIILAPNFEDRSVHCCHELVRAIARTEAAKSRVHWIVLTLQGPAVTEILDAMKAINTRKVMEILEDAGFENVQHKVVDYPISPDKFASLTSRLFRPLRGCDDLIVDFSALPRNLLSSLLKQVSVAGTQEASFPRVRKVWLIYSWAKAYPETAPEFLGEVVGQFSNEPLRNLLSDKTHAEILIFTCGSAYDAYSAMESARESGLGNQTGIHLVNFIHNQNFHQSHLQLRNHYGILREGLNHGADIRYVFTVRHALAYMRDIAALCASHRARGNRTLFAIGSFGPKPLAVAAHFVRQEYLASINDRSLVECDVLNSNGTQYLSPYSLGAAGISLFAYEPPSRADVL